MRQKVLTQEAYLRLRDKTMKELGSIVSDRQIPKSFTCDECPARFTCEFAADPYNTDGDCLAEK